MMFLQLGEAQAHRSALKGARYAKMSTTEHMHMMAFQGTTMKVDDVQHIEDAVLTTTSADKLAIWGYLMTQYNLKPGLQKFGARGESTAITEMMQLHMMDTWTAMDPSKLTREDSMKVLLSLLFLKEKRTGKVKGRACISRAPQ
jgi:hypothetical protein